MSISKIAYASERNYYDAKHMYGVDMQGAHLRLSW